MPSFFSILRKLNPLTYLKYVPHPEYGHYGGFYNRRRTWDSNLTDRDDTGPLEPVDQMDKVFQAHDAGEIGSWGLVKGVWKSKNPKRPVYGRIYKALAITYFLPGAIFDRR